MTEAVLDHPGVFLPFIAADPRIQKSQITRLLKGNAVEFLGLNNPARGPLFNHINFLASKGKKLSPWFKFS